MSISLQELDAQFSELLPEREALGRMSFSFAHDVPCHPHHHHTPLRAEAEVRAEAVRAPAVRPPAVRHPAGAVPAPYPPRAVR